MFAPNHAGVDIAQLTYGPDTWMVWSSTQPAYNFNTIPFCGPGKVLPPPHWHVFSYGQRTVLAGSGVQTALSPNIGPQSNGLQVMDASAGCTSAPPHQPNVAMASGCKNIGGKGSAAEHLLLHSSPLPSRSSNPPFSTICVTDQVNDTKGEGHSDASIRNRTLRR